MKKLISILAALAVVTTCSAVGFAEETVATPEIPAELTNELVKNPEGAENAGLYTVDLTSVANGQAQTTILAVKGEEISVGTIEYIGQDADPVFNFDLRNELKSGETVYVFAGGSDIPAQYFGYMAEEATTPEVEKITISGTVSGWYASLPMVTLYSGDTVVASKAVEPTETEGTGKFEFTVDKLENGTYTLKVNKVGYTTYTKSSLNDNVADISGLVRAGDVDASEAVNLSDLTELLKWYNKAVQTFTVDYDESGATNLTDLSYMIKNYNKGAISE